MLSLEFSSVVYLGCNRNEYQEYLLGDKGDRYAGLTNLPHSCVECIEILGASFSWSPKGPSRLVQGQLGYACRSTFQLELAFRIQRLQSVIGVAHSALCIAL